MKMAAFGIVLFGVLTAGYASAVVVPRYSEVNSEWMRAERGTPEKERLEDRRDKLRSRGQMYAMACIALGVVGLALAFIAGKKPGFPPFGVMLGGAILTLAGFGVIQGIGNVF